MYFDQLRQERLASLVDGTLMKLEKQASAQQPQGVDDDDLALLVKHAYVIGLEDGGRAGYEHGVEDGVTSITTKLAEADAFENGPTAAAYHEGRMSDHAQETRDGANELGMTINQGDEQITDGSHPTPAGTIGGGGGGGDDMEKESMAWLDSILGLDKHAEGEEGVEGEGGGSFESGDPVTVPGSGQESDEFGRKTPDLDRDQVNPRQAAYSQFVRDAVAGGLSAG